MSGQANYSAPRPGAEATLRTNEATRLVGGDEPMIDGLRISYAWEKAWPRMVAMAWHWHDVVDEYEAGNSDFAEEDYQEARQSLADLYSGDSEKIFTLLKLHAGLDLSSYAEFSTERLQDATVEQLHRGQGACDEPLPVVQMRQDLKDQSGGTLPSDQVNPDWFKARTKIIVRRPVDEVRLDDKTGSAPVVAAAPQVPAQSDPGMAMGPRVVHQGNASGEQYAKTVQAPEGRRRQLNGWAHVPADDVLNIVIMTIPPRPKHAREAPLAVAEYQSAGYVYPFTVTC